MTATPALTSGVPNGTESISSVQALSRSYTNSGGQVTETDNYFNLSGVTYSTLDIHRHRGNELLRDYVRLRHPRLAAMREQLPTGTIERTVRRRPGPHGQHLGRDE